MNCWESVAKILESIFNFVPVMNIVFESRQVHVCLVLDLNKIAAIEIIKKRIENSLVFQHHFGKILLSKVYNSVLCEKSTKLFCY